ncbi:hypothetical protein SS1G_00095 [Sclerotinia sclerotiorum 1980 UF-70]|uniref:AA1-like domain-containing protein n=2 Tax=Sclerotinia sclerotiorum (strain ATCC 18683 / 1980 / Ss-1) TaxID=665079 RepID=A7E473_SCLS1|nr:hypothetical protein SS1G_00095 [Sclerotinia sclerotiorum 1980 UF-70]APA08204.1 hypothetical protein sscle_03g029740 [Sclerotinia sclerotiorum 1980 UF-70]EDN90695.1 hypothetical protein SS1G_00095 [Sclerotinia sclerotiorum 1980 UF-70]
MFSKSLLLITAFTASVLSASLPVGVVGKRSTSASSAIPDVQWKVTDFTRPCIATICTYNFTINVIPTSGATVKVPCLYNDTSSTPPSSSTPQTHSYSSLSCSKTSNDWQVNWGYNTDGDFAVMTIVDTVKQQDAFFGWNSVISTTNFEDKGPETVYAVGTFN